jgi:hypothetical protein
MRSKWTMWVLIGAAMLLLLAWGRLDLLLITAPVSLVVSYLAASAGQRKIWNRR